MGGRKLIWKIKVILKNYFFYILNVPKLNDKNKPAFYCFWSSNWWSIGPSRILAAVFLKDFFFFWCGPFLKYFLNFLHYYFCFMFWLFGREVCGILTPQPGLKPTAPVLGGKVLTTEPSEKPLVSYSFHNTITGSILAWNTTNLNMREKNKQMPFVDVLI